MFVLSKPERWSNSSARPWRHERSLGSGCYHVLVLSGGPYPYLLLGLTRWNTSLESSTIVASGTARTGWFEVGRESFVVGKSRKLLRSRAALNIKAYSKTPIRMSHGNSVSGGCDHKVAWYCRHSTSALQPSNWGKRRWSCVQQNGPDRRGIRWDNMLKNLLWTGLAVRSFIIISMQSCGENSLFSE